MKLLWKKIFLLLTVSSSCSEHSITNTYYITPTPDTPCPGDPCHTLSQYAEQYYWNNISSNTTLVFLPGDHTLNVTISMGSDTNYTGRHNQTAVKYFYYPHPSLTLLGSPSSLPEVTSRIVCTWPAGFVFSGISELHISSLAFISCGHNDSAAVNIFSVQEISISNCIFQNNTNNWRSVNLSKKQGGAIYVSYSTLTLTRNTFQNNFALAGSALYVDKSNIVTLSDNRFQNNSADLFGGALCVLLSNTLTLSESTFHSNSAGYAGGALYADTNNTLTLSVNTFQNSSAKHGGALLAYANSTLALSENIFQDNSAKVQGGALYASRNSTLTLSENTFQNNSALVGGALLAGIKNTLTLTENIFQNNSADNASAILAHINNTLTFSNNTFQKNLANNSGGVLLAQTSNTLTLSNNVFLSNSADYAGGTVCAEANNTITFSENTFHNNSAFGGGAIFAARNNTLTLSNNNFQNNSADSDGAILYATIGNSLSLSENTFRNNSAVNHGGVIFAYAKNTIILSENTFHTNSADYDGGTSYAFTNNIITFSMNTFQNNSADSGGVLHANVNNNLNLSQNTFEDNSAGYGGGALWVHKSILNLSNNNLTRNTAQLYGGGIFCFSNSTLRILENNNLKNNTAKYGGGIAALESQIMLAGDLLIANNNASFGAGLYVEQSMVSGHATFINNFASADGGAVYSSGSRLYFKQHITLKRNSALNGGGLLLTDRSQLHLQPNTTINFTNNSAGKKGGAIKVEKNNPLSYCTKVSCEFLPENDCFFHIITERQYDILTYISDITELHTIRMFFQNNIAFEAGVDLYGGSVDHCSLNFINQSAPSILHGNEYRCPNSGDVFNYITSSEEQSLDISSDPMHICTCDDGKPDCSVSSVTRSVYPGGRTVVPIIAYGQRNGTTPAVIHVTPESKIEVDERENTQSVKNNCTPLTYTLQTHAVGTVQKMTLYLEGPCPFKKGTVSSLLTNIIEVYVSIHKCPPGFELSQFQPVCSCAQRLQRLTNTCMIDDRKIERSREFWVGYIANSTSDGLILHPHCPFDYCTTKTMYIAVDDSDEQCSNNRTGLLCGKCGQNFSLLLGNNRCLQCPNTYLWLIVAFAFAGVTLVLLLLVLRLTVAVGTINGLVFYANTFAMNSATFFRPQNANVLTVFIAWLNLDLGIETCFYNGMDTYAKAWLQFVFPVYVWALVGIIIVISHYSSKVATILGTNPIAVLATLFLLSYTKFLRTIVMSLSYTLLEYPNNSQIAVWLYDGNISYLSNKHIPLFTVALVCLIVLFLPYTLFLFFSQWLRSKSGQWRIFHWVNNYRVLPFLDAYHAPYTDKHRYWTGLMLLVRCILFLLFAFNALGDPSVNLLAIGSVTAVLLIVYAIFGNRIYKTWYLNMLELSFIANVSILSLATLYIRSTGGNQNAVTFTSIGIAFATFIGIVIFHSAQQIKHAPRLWRKVFPRNDMYELVPQTEEDSDLEGVSPPSPPDPSDGCATVTHINFRELLDFNNSTELREPCMEMDN